MAANDLNIVERRNLDRPLSFTEMDNNWDELIAIIQDIHGTGGIFEAIDTLDNRTSNIDNTSDLDKPISTAVAAAFTGTNAAVQQNTQDINTINNTTIPGVISSINNDINPKITALQNGKFDKTVSIPSTANLDTYTSEGRYSQSVSANATAARNYPALYAGILTVMVASSNMIFQRYEAFNMKTYFRMFYSTTWRAWEEVSNRSEKIVDNNSKDPDTYVDQSLFYTTTGPAPGGWFIKQFFRYEQNSSITASTARTQIAMVYSTPTNTTGQIWYRRHNGSSFSAWVRLDGADWSNIRGKPANIPTATQANWNFSWSNYAAQPTYIMVADASNSVQPKTRTAIQFNWSQIQGVPEITKITANSVDGNIYGSAWNGWLWQYLENKFATISVVNNKTQKGAYVRRGTVTEYGYTTIGVNTGNSWNLSIPGSGLGLDNIAPNDTAVCGLRYKRESLGSTTYTRLYILGATYYTT